MELFRALRANDKICDVMSQWESSYRVGYFAKMLKQNMIFIADSIGPREKEHAARVYVQETSLE